MGRKSTDISSIPTDLASEKCIRRNKVRQKIVEDDLSTQGGTEVRRVLLLLL